MSKSTRRWRCIATLAPCVVGIAGLCGQIAFAGNATDAKPLAALEEAKSFATAPGLAVDLVAAEPLVASPCAMAFDERGRLFVAENRGYPIGPKEGEPPAGMIALLEDTDGDGVMDKRTVFAEGLTFPNGVLPWQGGLIVTCAPDVLFLQDTKGLGHADVRRVLLTGFDTSKSTQLRVNCPTLGPDGWIYFAAGLAGGTITSPEHPERPPVKMTGDLRWNPLTGEIENVDGKSQYGISFDDAGNRFMCMNRIQVQHVVLSANILRRNPALAFSDTVQNCPEILDNPFLPGHNGAARVYPISANITTADSHAGTFTAACGIMIWRGGALPDEYRGCAFSCDPTGNLVHVDKLQRQGSTFAAMPLLEGREFVASRDDWFRPVFLTSGPDGALYICDMYRRVIEHPDYLPEEIRKHTDFAAGKTFGRIWRVHSPEKVFPRVDLAGRRCASAQRTSARCQSMDGRDRAAIASLELSLGRSQAGDHFPGRACDGGPALVSRAALARAALRSRTRAGAAIPDRRCRRCGAGHAHGRSRRGPAGRRAPREARPPRRRLNGLSTLCASPSPLGYLKDDAMAIPLLAKAATAEGADRWRNAAVVSSAKGRELALLKEVLALAKGRLGRARHTSRRNAWARGRTARGRFARGDPGTAAAGGLSDPRHSRRRIRQRSGQANRIDRETRWRAPRRDAAHPFDRRIAGRGDDPSPRTRGLVRRRGEAHRAGRRRKS